MHRTVLCERPIESQQAPRAVQRQRVEIERLPQDNNASNDGSGFAVGAAVAIAGAAVGYCAYSYSTADSTVAPSSVAESAPMPSQWGDTPSNQRKWSRMQHNEQFLRRQLARHGVLVCHYCKRQPLKIFSWEESSRMSHYERLDSNQATADHVVPRSKGGDDSDSNLVVACYKCNYNKGDSQ